MDERNRARAIANQHTSVAAMMNQAPSTISGHIGLIWIAAFTSAVRGSGRALVGNWRCSAFREVRVVRGSDPAKVSMCRASTLTIVRAGVSPSRRNVPASGADDRIDWSDDVTTAPTSANRQTYDPCPDTSCRPAAVDVR